MSSAITRHLRYGGSALICLAGVLSCVWLFGGPDVLGASIRGLIFPCVALTWLVPIARHQDGRWERRMTWTAIGFSVLSIAFVAGEALLA